jgi:sulfofructose kinase
LRREPGRILCAGMGVLDEVFRVNEFPPPDGKIEALAFVEIGGGNSANAAITVARLGGQATYAGPLGDDIAGTRILENLTREKVTLRGCVRIPGLSSARSAIFVNARGERSIVTHRSSELSSVVPADSTSLVADADGVLIDNRMSAFGRPVGAAARARGLPVVLDADKATTPADPLLTVATHVIFSSECLRQTVGSDDLADGVARIAAATGRFVATTDGPNDVIWCEDGKLFRMPVFKITAVDTLAAGDVFHGAFTLAMVEGVPVPQALRFAAATAGLKCLRFGGSATIPTRSEVEAFLRSQ